MSEELPRERKRIELKDVGDVTIVNFVDKKILDEENIRITGKQLFCLVDEVDESGRKKIIRKKIILNFGNVEFFSGPLLGKLITLNKKVTAIEGKLVLCNMNPGIYEVFEITRLSMMFKILENEQDSLRFLSPEKPAS